MSYNIKSIIPRSERYPIKRPSFKVYDHEDFKQESFFLQDKISEMQLEIRNSWYVAGGAITSAFTYTPVNDFDIFFLDNKSLSKFKDKLPDGAKEIMAVRSERHVNSWTYDIKGNIVQLITRFTGEPEKILRGFDFTICMGAYYPTTHKFILCDTFFRDLASRNLVINPDAKSLISTLIRVRKFVDKGYRIDSANMLKLALLINRLDLKNYRVLIEQLEGAYGNRFNSLTYRLNKEFNEGLSYSKPVDLDILFGMIQAILE